MAKLDLTKLGGGQKPAIHTPKPEETKPAGLGFLMNRGKADAPVAPSPGEPVVPAVEIPDQPIDTPTKVGGLAFLRNKTPAPTPTPAAAAPAPKPAPAATPAKSDDLQNLLDNDSGGSKPSPVTRTVSRFADEEPAIAPDRKTEGLDDDMKRFVSSLDSVYQIVHEPDLLGGVIKNIMMELARKPEYRQLIAPKDVHIMIRGMRDSMGMARIKKEESKAKRSGASKKKTIKVDDLDALAALDELGMDFN
jgi:hypothetical protein